MARSDEPPQMRRMSPLLSKSSTGGVVIADNLFHGSVRETLRELFVDGEVLVATGYQDFLSAVAIIAEMLDIEALSSETPLRLLFGTNTANATRLRTRRRSLSEEAKRHFLQRNGVYIEDPADLLAVTARNAVRSGAIAIRIFDDAQVQGNGAGRLFHAKVFVGSTGSVLGSANFSRGGLGRNIELVDHAARGTARDEARREAAERFWGCGSDWSQEAIAILEALLKGVSPQYAVARIAAELRGFEMWKPVRGARIGKAHDLEPFQRELVYETTATVYEHGFAFVEAPPGAGKTIIGRHLAITLANTYAATFGRKTSAVEHSCTVVVAPPAVEEAWMRDMPGHVKFLPTTQFSSKKTQTLDAIDGLLGEAAALIVDEAHNFATRWRHESARARRFETVPALWTACLSATLVGNHGTDTILTMQERRASPNMTREFAERMDNLIEDESSRRRADESRDHHPNVEALAEEMARFVCRRSRSCVGEKPPGRTYPVRELGYPTFESKAIELELSEEERKTIEEIDTALDFLEDPGRSRRAWAEETRTRLGSVNEQKFDLVRSAVRALRMLLRVCNTAALWEAEQGAIAKYLLESPQSRLALTGKHSADAPVETVRSKLRALEGGRLDEERVRKLRDIAQRHQAVVFVSERAAVLQYFAHKLAVPLARSGFETFLATDRFNEEFQERYLGGKSEAVTLFRGSTASKQLQARFDAHAVKRSATVRKRLAFTTLKRAEGINLQAACAVVLLGVGADIKMLCQALGRIDRVDTPHPHIMNYTLSLPDIRVASDEKAKARLLERHRFAHGAVQQASEGEEETDTIAALLKQNTLARTLRPTNVYDCVRALELKLPQAVTEAVGDTRRHGPWGIEIAELSGDEPFTVFCLRGVGDKAGEPRRAFAPPRLVLARDDGTFELDQAEVVQAVTKVYDEMASRGLADKPTRWTEHPELLERVQEGLEKLTPWCLRPGRTIALLDTLAEFVSEGREEAHALFQHLSLPALECLYQEWLEALDPAWVQAKRALRETEHNKGPAPDAVHTANLFDEPLDAEPDEEGTDGDDAGAQTTRERAPRESPFPGYLHCGRVLECLLERDADEVAHVRERMTRAIEEAEAESEGADVELWSRVAVIVRVSATNA